MSVILEKHIKHWLQDEPEDIEGAAAAWHAKLSEQGQRQAVLYSMKVNNPRADVEIDSIDILPGVDAKGNVSNRAVPAVVAITVGRIAE